MHRRILRIVAVIITVIYPFAVFFALRRHFSLQFMVLILGIGVLSGFLRSGKKLFLVAGLFLCTALYIFGNDVFLKLYPVMMNLLFFVAFYLSLFKKPLITVFAEKMHSSLDEKELIYTKKVTVAWTVFLAINSILSFVTVFLSDKVWMLYNGLVSYILIGIMFVSEYLIRYWRKHVS